MQTNPMIRLEEKIINLGNETFFSAGAVLNARRNEPRRKFASLGGGGGAGGVSFNADGIVDAATATFNRDTD